MIVKAFVVVFFRDILSISLLNLRDSLFTVTGKFLSSRSLVCWLVVFLLQDGFEKNLNLLFLSLQPS